MCLAVPGRVVELAEETAVLEIAGQRTRVGLGLLPDSDRPRIGDYLVAHLGMALSRMEEAEALVLMEMLREVAGADFGDATEDPGVTATVSR